MRTIIFVVFVILTICAALPAQEGLQTPSVGLGDGPRWAYPVMWERIEAAKGAMKTPTIPLEVK